MDVYLPPGHCWAQSPQTKSWGWECLLLWNGVPVPQCFWLLQESQPQHPTCYLQKNHSARPEHQGTLWRAILPTNSHPDSSSAGEWLFWSHYWTVCKFVPPGNCSASFFPSGFLARSSFSLEANFHPGLGKETEKIQLAILVKVYLSL